MSGTVKQGGASGELNHLTNAEYLALSGRERIVIASRNLEKGSSTVQEEIPGLSLSVDVGAYLVEAGLSFNANVLGGINMTWYTAASMSHALVAAYMIPTGSNGLVLKSSAQLSSGEPFGALATSGTYILRGCIRFTTAGAVTLLAAQYTSNAALTVVQADSWLRLTQVVLPN